MSVLVDRANRAIRSIGRGIWITIAATLLIAVTVYVFSNAVLRRSIERTMNHHLKGYTAHVGAAHFHLFGFSIILVDTRITQDAYPNPPIIEIPHLHASVQWRELLRLHLVADCRLDRPRLYLNLPQLRAEEKDPTPLNEKGWQQALEAVYPMKINVFRIADADLVYQDEKSSRPLHLSHLNLRVGNIRNIAFPDDVYPSTLTLEAGVFDQGQLRLDGRANFLAVPHVTMKGSYTLQRIALDYFKPITAKYNVEVQGGTLSSSGNFEYATKTTSMRVHSVEIRGVDLEYSHRQATAAAESARASEVKRSIQAASNSPTISLTIEKLHIVESTFGLRNEAGTPPYRLFLSDAAMHLSNVTNQGAWGQARGTLTGMFMGSGAATVDLNLKPEGKHVDMDLAIQIEGTQATTLNALLQDTVGFEVSGGTFAFYSQADVRASHVQGYIKPIFTDLKVLKPQREAHENFLAKIKERVAALIAAILKNPNHEIATTVTLQGNLSDPQFSTWQAVGGLLRNAFVQPLLHRFGRG